MTDPKPRKRSRSILTRDPATLPPKAENRIHGVLASNPSLALPPQPADQDDLSYFMDIGTAHALECPLCATVLCTKFSLKKHLQTHLKGKRVLCRLCDARFQTKQALEYHMSSAHSGQ